MSKWADYCISKISINGSTISEATVHQDLGSSIGAGVNRDRDWIVAQVIGGKSFCCITKNSNGQWNKDCDFNYSNNGFNWSSKLPEVKTRRKTFVSYYHNDDQNYQQRFHNLFDDLVVTKSVKYGDIDSENSTDYIKQLIQNDFLNDVTILVVLVGPKTKCRKHVDWEISGALNLKVGNSYAGLIGLLLPTHPDYGKSSYTADNLPKRLAANLDSGYASLYDWTDDRLTMQKRIESAYLKRNEHTKIINLSIPQMQKNLCD